MMGAQNREHVSSPPGSHFSHLVKKDIASDALVADVASEMDSYSLLKLLNTLRRFDLIDRLPNDWAKA